MQQLRMPDNYIGLSRGYSSSHLGVDFGWNPGYGGQNAMLYSPGYGKVTAVIDGYGNTYPGSRIYGNYIMIDHGGGTETLLGHALRGSFKVKRGDIVQVGQPVCQMNNSGYSNGSHLHFEVRVNGNKVDPLKYTYVYPGQVISPNTACRGQIKTLGEDPGPVPSGTVGTPVATDAAKDQVEVTTQNLFGRSSPTRLENNGNVSGYMAPGLYNILHIKDMTAELSNGYLWYEVEPNLWLADIGAPNVICHPTSEPPVLYDMSLFSMIERDKKVFESEAIGRSIKYKVTER